MKVIILAGGYGTRLSEYTDVIPKPMVPIGGKPILWHIMQRYASYGFKDFYLALGYKSEVIKEYFHKFNSLTSDFSINLSTGKIEIHNNIGLDWNVTFVETGKNSMTGGRLKRMKPFINNDSFMLTYGDGVADINLDALLSFHKRHGKMVTVTAVHPVARFGELEIKDNLVKSFQEKPQVKIGWINGGFFICEPDIFDLIEDDSTILEGQPLEFLANQNQLMAYKHNGFWQCMDTKRDKDFLEELWQKNEATWYKKDNGK